MSPLLQGWWGARAIKETGKAHLCHANGWQHFWCCPDAARGILRWLGCSYLRGLRVQVSWSPAWGGFPGQGRHVYIYIYLYLGFYPYTYKYIYIHIYIYPHIYIHIYIYIYVHIYLHVHMYIYIYIHIYIFFISIYIYIHIYIFYIYIYIYTDHFYLYSHHIYIHTYIHHFYIYIDLPTYLFLGISFPRHCLWWYIHKIYLSLLHSTIFGIMTCMSNDWYSPLNHIPAPHNERNRNCVGCIDLLGDLASAHDGRHCLHLRFKAPSAAAACVRDMRDAHWAWNPENIYSKDSMF